jgi:RNA 3'-terminal phosphate cyclase (ATP)
MVEVDGSAGGGQILRTALTLSMLSGESVTVESVRGDRSEPGLKHQHLAAVEAAAAVCDADVEGAELGAETVAFDPGEPTGGEYETTIETAGSCTLVFDTIWPVATVIGEPLTLSATGGTDVKWSPPTAYYRRVKLPLLRELGLAATVDPDRPGFYPVGGGGATLRLWPSSVSPLVLDGGPAKGPLRASVHSLASESLADADVADRQAEAAESALDDLNAGPVPEVVRREVTYASADSPGSSVVVGVVDDGVRAGFTAFGERGTPAEDVGREAVAGVGEFLDSGAGVDEHLADQCLVALALGGGRVHTSRTTDHIETNRGVLATFGYDVSVELSGETVVVTG